MNTMIVSKRIKNATYKLALTKLSTRLILGNIFLLKIQIMSSKRTFIFQIFIMLNGLTLL